METSPLPEISSSYSLQTADNGSSISSSPIGESIPNTEHNDESMKGPDNSTTSTNQLCSNDNSPKSHIVAQESEHDINQRNENKKMAGICSHLETVHDESGTSKPSTSTPSTDEIEIIYTNSPTKSTDKECTTEKINSDQPRYEESKKCSNSQSEACFTISKSSNETKHCLTYLYGYGSSPNGGSILITFQQQI